MHSGIICSRRTSAAQPGFAQCFWHNAWVQWSFVRLLLAVVRVAPHRSSKSITLNITVELYALLVADQYNRHFIYCYRTDFKFFLIFFKILHDVVKEILHFRWSVHSVNAGPAHLLINYTASWQLLCAELALAITLIFCALWMCLP